MKKCTVCRGTYMEEKCPFGEGNGLPWAEDYVKMGQGKLEHAEHQMNDARWVLHSSEEHGNSILEWAEKMMGEKV